MTESFHSSYYPMLSLSPGATMNAHSSVSMGLDLDWCLGGCDRKCRIGSVYCSSACFRKAIQCEEDEWNLVSFDDDDDDDMQDDPIPRPPNPAPFSISRSGSGGGNQCQSSAAAHGHPYSYDDHCSYSNRRQSIDTTFSHDSTDSDLRKLFSSSDSSNQSSMRALYSMLKHRVRNCSRK